MNTMLRKQRLSPVLFIVFLWLFCYAPCQADLIVSTPDVSFSAPQTISSWIEVTASEQDYTIDGFQVQLELPTDSPVTFANLSMPASRYLFQDNSFSFYTGESTDTGIDVSDVTNAGAESLPSGAFRRIVEFDLVLVDPIYQYATIDMTFSLVEFWEDPYTLIPASHENPMITLIPEPTTMFVLGCSSLVLLRKRRGN